MAGANLEEGAPQYAGYPTAIQLFLEYCQQAEVAEKLSAVKEVAAVQRRLYEHTMQPDVLRQAEAQWIRSHNNPVYAKEVNGRGGCSREGCPHKSCLVQKLNHKVELLAGGNKPRRPDGAPIHPRSYDEQTMTEQSPFMESLCVQDHRSTTVQQNKARGGKTPTRQFIQIVIARQLKILLFKKCAYTGARITEENVDQVDFHHVTAMLNVVKDGKLIELAKLGDGDMIARIADKSSSWPEFRDRLFPSLVKCLLIFANAHRIITHQLPEEWPFDDPNPYPIKKICGVETYVHQGAAEIVPTPASVLDDSRNVAKRPASASLLDDNSTVAKHPASLSLLEHNSDKTKRPRLVTENKVTAPLRIFVAVVMESRLLLQTQQRRLFVIHLFP